MITFQVEKLKTVKEEVKPLLEEHYKELALYQDVIEFDPDWDKYQDLCNANILHIVTARDGDKLIGYYVSLIIPHLHYKKTIYAHNDILFIHPDYRGTTAAYRMFKYAETCMREKGVTVMSIHMKTSTPFDNMLEKMGWDYGERNYFKCLKES